MGMTRWDTEEVTPDFGADLWADEVSFKTYHTENGVCLICGQDEQRCDCDKEEDDDE